MGIMFVSRGNGGYSILREDGDYLMRESGLDYLMLKETGCNFMLREMWLCRAEDHFARRENGGLL